MYGSFHDILLGEHAGSLAGACRLDSVRREKFGGMARPVFALFPASTATGPSPLRGRAKFRLSWPPNLIAPDHEISSSWPATIRQCPARSGQCPNGLKADVQCQWHFSFHAGFASWFSTVRKLAEHEFTFSDNDLIEW